MNEKIKNERRNSGDIDNGKEEEECSKPILEQSEIQDDNNDMSDISKSIENLNEENDEISQQLSFAKIIISEKKKYMNEVMEMMKQFKELENKVMENEKIFREKTQAKETETLKLKKEKEKLEEKNEMLCKEIKDLKNKINFIQNSEDIRKRKIEKMKIKSIDNKDRGVFERMKNKKNLSTEDENKILKQSLERLQKELKDSKSQILRQNVLLINYQEMSKNNKRVLTKSEKKKVFGIKRRIEKENKKIVRKVLKDLNKSLKIENSNYKDLEFELEKGHKPSKGISLKSVCFPEISEDVKPKMLLVKKKIDRLSKEIDGLEKVQRALNSNSTSSASFLYGIDKDDRKIRDLLDIQVIKLPLKSSSRREVAFYEEVFHGVTNVKFNKSEKEKFGMNTITPGNGFLNRKIKAPEKNYFLNYYGYWHENEDLKQSYYLVTEKQEKTLREYLEENKTLAKNDPNLRFTFIERCDIILEVVNCVKLLHTNDLCHNLIQPENFVVCSKENSVISNGGTGNLRDGEQIKIINFQALRKSNEIRKETKENAKYYFLDPMLTKLSANKLDKHALKRDIFMLGCLMDFILDERVLFKEFLELIRKHCMETFDSCDVAKAAYNIIVNKKDYLNIKEKLKNKCQGFVDVIDCAIKENNFIHLSTGIQYANKVSDQFNYKTLKEVRKIISSCFSTKENLRPSIDELYNQLEKIITKHKSDYINFEKTKRKRDLENRKVMETLPVIAKKEFTKWNNENVFDWLEFNNFQEGAKGKSFAIYADELKDLVGKDLETISNIKLKKRGIDNPLHRLKIMKAVRELRITKTFPYETMIVLRKIENLVEKNGGKKFEDSNFKFLARSLSTPEDILKTYLNPSILKESLDKYIGELEIDDLLDSIEENSDDDDDDLELLGDISTGIATRLKDIPRQKFKLPIKLVVTELTNQYSKKLARRILSPIMDKIPKFKKEFGIFHTAIIVGPWYLEWNDSSLVLPRKLYSGMALVSADIDTTTLIRNTTIDDVSKKLATVVCDWNVTKTYVNNNPTDDPGLGNCQDFCEEIMRVLNIELTRDGAFGQFLTKMQKNGTCDLEFLPSKQFKEMFELDLDKYQFSTHAELDKFVKRLREINEVEFQLNFKEEFKLLKSFDRAFWLRHFKQGDDEKFKPFNGGCPFRDPRSTKSYLTYT